MYHQVNLTASEIGYLWSGYEIDAMALCFLKYFAEASQDPDVKSVLKQAMGLAELNNIFPTQLNIFRS